MSLKLPSVFDFDTLFKIDAIIRLQGHELFSLLRVFLSGGLDDYKKWESDHAASIDKYGDRSTLSTRFAGLNLVVLFSIRTQPGSIGTKDPAADTRISCVPEHWQERTVCHPRIHLTGTSIRGREMGHRWCVFLPFSFSSVPPTPLLVIRAGLVSGKLSQSSRVFHITRSTSRAFEQDQWFALEQRLVAWQTGLAAVLAVVTSAREKGSERLIGENYKAVSAELAAQSQSVPA